VNAFPLTTLPYNHGWAHDPRMTGVFSKACSNYRCLHRLGAPPPNRVLTTGGGAENAGWSEIRKRYLGVPVVPSLHREAAYGAAIIALTGGIPA